MPRGNRTANRGTIDSHPEGCGCVGCEARRKGGPTPSKAWKLPDELTAYIRQRGGGPWLAELVREVREAEADPFEGQPTPEQIEEENERKYGVWRPRPYDD